MKTFKAVTLVVLLVSSVLLVGTLGAAAGTDSVFDGDAPDESATAPEDEITEIGRQDITVRDLVVTVSDTHVRGTGLPNESIDEATYTVEDSVITTNGFLVTYQDETYRICPITVTVDDVGLELRNVSVGEGETDDGTATSHTAANEPSSDQGDPNDGTETDTDNDTDDRCPHEKGSCDCCG